MLTALPKRNLMAIPTTRSETRRNGMRGERPVGDRKSQRRKRLVTEDTIGWGVPCSCRL